MRREAAMGRVEEWIDYHLKRSRRIMRHGRGWEPVLQQWKVRGVRVKIDGHFHLIPYKEGG